MNIKKFFNFLWIAMGILFIAIFIYMEIARVYNPRQLSSNELTQQIISRIRLYSWLFTYLIFYLIVLGSMAFVKVFKLLVSPSVGGNIFKVILTVFLYIICIVLTFKGYNNILNVNYFVELTGVLSEPSIKTSGTHMIILLLLFIAKSVKESIRKENYKKHMNNVSKTNLYHRHVEFRDIIERNSASKDDNYMSKKGV